MAWLKSAAAGQTKRPLVWLATLTWVLIYGGLLVLVWGYFVGTTNAAAGWAMAAAGSAAAVVGCALVYLRSRTGD